MNRVLYTLSEHRGLKPSVTGGFVQARDRPAVEVQKAILDSVESKMRRAMRDRTLRIYQTWNEIKRERAYDLCLRCMFGFWSERGQTWIKTGSVLLAIHDYGKLPP